MSEPNISSRAAPVRFEGVSKVFGKDVVAVDDINLHVDAGKLVTLLGPSGCGKTTTLRMIAGLEMATSGRILIGDRDVTKLPATKTQSKRVTLTHLIKLIGQVATLHSTTTLKTIQVVANY